MLFRVFQVLVFIALLSSAKADLLPGDFAVVRISDSQIGIMALRTIGGTSPETIEITNSVWKQGSFDSSGSTITVTLPQMSPGKVRVIHMNPVELKWNRTLSIYQHVNVPWSATPVIRHLMMLEANRDGLRWYPTPAGLDPDLTHIVIPELDSNPGEINHVLKDTFFAASRTPLEWCQALSNYRSWEPPANNPSFGLLQEITLGVKNSAGMVSFASPLQHVDEATGLIEIPVRRQFGSGGSIRVNIREAGKVSAFQDWNNTWVSGLYPDLVDIEYGNGRFVAVGPKELYTFQHNGTNWDKVSTRLLGVVTSLQLCSITFYDQHFYACSLDGKIYASGDGTEWELLFNSSSYTQFSNGATFRGIRYLPLNNVLVALGTNGTLAWCNTADTSQWQMTTLAAAQGRTLMDIAEAQRMFLIVGENAMILRSSVLSSGWSNLHEAQDYRDLYSIASAGEYGFYTVGQKGLAFNIDKLGSTVTSVATDTQRSLTAVASLSLLTDSSMQAFIQSGGTAQQLMATYGASNINLALHTVAVGVNGCVSSNREDRGFLLNRFINRSASLYAVAHNQTENGLFATRCFAVGEYGSIVELNLFERALSGEANPAYLQSPQGGQATNDEVSVDWADGVNDEQYVTFSLQSVSTPRERVDLELTRPDLPVEYISYMINRSRMEVLLFDSDFSSGTGKTFIQSNFGAFLSIVDGQISVDASNDWQYTFRVVNHSPVDSGPLLLRFLGTNIPDRLLLGGNGLPANSTSPSITVKLTEPVERIALMEKFRGDELISKYEDSVNGRYVSGEWNPNQIYPRSIATYIDEGTNLAGAEVAGIELFDDNTLSSFPYSQKKTAKSTPSISATFNGSVPTRPADAPSSASIIMIGAAVQGPTGMVTRESYGYFMKGTYFNTQNGKVENYAVTSVNWSLKENNQNPKGLAIQDNGTLDVKAFPAVAYPRSLVISASTTEGTGTNSSGQPNTVTDTHDLSVTRSSSDLDFEEWVATTSLSGGEKTVDDDPDNDDLSNLVEFALGTNPKAPNVLPAEISSSFESGTGGFTFTFTVPKARDEVIYTVEMATEVNGIYTSYDPSFVSDNESTETWSVTANLGQRGFARLKIETYNP